ncbi:MAG: diacylglycerol kinase [Burkholderiales bacterium]
MNETRSESPHKGRSGLDRLWRALGYSIEGLTAALQYEDAFRQALILAVILVPVAWFSHVSNASKALLIACVVLVLIVELINSAIEAVVDRVSLEDHQLSKRAKDMGSAATFLTILNVIVVWSIVLFCT